MVVKELSDRDVRKIHQLLVKSRHQGGLSSFDVSDLLHTLGKAYPNSDTWTRTEVINQAWDLIEERNLGDRNTPHANLG